MLCCDRLAGVDIYSFDQKINHIARHVRLPDAPELGPGATRGPPAEHIPPILVINVQLPVYSVCHDKDHDILLQHHADKPACHQGSSSNTTTSGAISFACPCTMEHTPWAVMRRVTARLALQHLPACTAWLSGLHEAEMVHRQIACHVSDSMAGAHCMDEAADGRVRAGCSRPCLGARLMAKGRAWCTTSRCPPAGSPTKRPTRLPWPSSSASWPTLWRQTGEPLQLQP